METNKRKPVNGMEILAIIILLGATALLVYIYINLKSDNYECVNDPLVYGVKELEKSNNAEISCSCSMNKIGSAILMVTNNGTSQKIIGGETKSIPYDNSWKNLLNKSLLK